MANIQIRTEEHEVPMVIMVAGSIDGIEIFEEELHKSIERQVCIWVFFFPWIEMNHSNARFEFF